MNSETSDKSMSPSEFRETAGEKVLNSEQQELLSRKICDLSLKIQGTQLDGLISELYQEMRVVSVSEFITTLVMNYLYRGQFIDT